MKRLLSIILIFYSSYVSANQTAVSSVALVSSGDIVKIVLSLMFVVICVCLLAWGVKKLKGFSYSSEGQLKIIAGMSIGTREKILLLQAGDKQLLIGVTQGAISPLYQFDDPIIVNNATDKNDSFVDSLKLFMQRKDR